MVVNDINIFQRMRTEKKFLERKKKRLSEYKTFFVISTLSWFNDKGTNENCKSIVDRFSTFSH